jgi:hypothetical protein
LVGVTGGINARLRHDAFQIDCGGNSCDGRADIALGQRIGNVTDGINGVGAILESMLAVRLEPA